MKTFLSSALFVVIFSISILAQVKTEQPKFAQSAAGQTVLLGTYTWDAETDAFPQSGGKASGEKGDIWWEQINDKEQRLVPRNRATLAEVKEKDFASLGIEDLKTLTYSRKPISNEFLVPGAIVALRTSDGNFAKIKVVGYRALHDFSFKEAAVLRENWKTLALNKSDKENYHLEIEWVLYSKP